MKVTKISLVISAIFIGFASFSQTFSAYIVVDQFGYTPNANKVAVIRDPQTGFDAASSFTPSTTYKLINADNNQPVFSAVITAWKSGATDVSSGDKAWWFDFSSYTTPGRYYVKDGTLAARSAEFVIADTVYKSVLKAAMRMLYYQRSSFAKVAPYAGNGWTGAASHIKPLQENNARLYSNLTAGTEKDLHGGWYDAGDLNKYTAWTASYVITLLTAYQENPTVFTDDFNLPESGNGVPDILDEVQWGIDHLLRMQQSNGSCLSVLSSDGGSPPSAATGQSKYGPATTNATLKCAEAFAFASKVYKNYSAIKFGTYASNLQTKAIAAWDWADANPSIVFNNNSKDDNTLGVAAGNQETDDLGRKTSKLGAALYLYELTGQAKYLTYFETNYGDMPLVAWTNYVSQYFLESQSLLLHYLSLAGIDATIANKIRTTTKNAVNTTGDFAAALTSETDPYRSFIKDYNWGSNQYKSLYGNLLWELQANDIDVGNNEFYLNASEEYLHYIHGVNPLQLVYLTNMGSYGAEKSANEMYHTWFCDGSAKWDRVGTSTYGPPPGFLMGGANNSYDWDDNCKSATPNTLCGSAAPSPPKGQPQQKSYKDFNTSWPLNSWQITETSLGYQTAYIRLLSKFVTNGTNVPTSTNTAQASVAISIMPNPTQDRVTITVPASVASNNDIKIEFYSVLGNNVLTKNLSNATSFSIAELPNGVYVIKVSQDGMLFTDRLVKMQ